jgi:hypothetical protein
MSVRAAPASQRESPRDGPVFQSGVWQFDPPLRHCHGGFCHSGCCCSVCHRRRRTILHEQDQSATSWVCMRVPLSTKRSAVNEPRPGKDVRWRTRGERARALRLEAVHHHVVHHFCESTRSPILWETFGALHRSQCASACSSGMFFVRLDGHVRRLSGSDHRFRAAHRSSVQKCDSALERKFDEGFLQSCKKGSSAQHRPMAAFCPSGLDDAGL